MSDESVGAKLLELENLLKEYRLWWDEIIKADDQRKEHATGALFMLEKVEDCIKPAFDQLAPLKDEQIGYCEICRSPFAQNTGRGRKRATCSSACKQKKVRNNRIGALKASIPKQGKLF